MLKAAAELRTVAVDVLSKGDTPLEVFDVYGRFFTCGACTLHSGSIALAVVIPV